MARCLLALGSNLGDRHAILSQACAAVMKLDGCQLLARSRWHDTVPIGGETGQGEFLNGAILVETTVEPLELAAALQQIETSLGRQRTERWDARTLDIDMLHYGQQMIDTADLTVPHPRMSFRKFVLEPATEIAGQMLHPTSGWTIARLLAHLQNSLRYVVVASTEKPIASWLVSQLSQKLSCPVWAGASENLVSTGVLQPDRGIEFPDSNCGKPPVLAILSPSELGEMAVSQITQKNCLHPALVIAVDVAQPQNLRVVAASTGLVADRKVVQDVFANRLDYPGLGPSARITVDDPAAVLQEAEAALRCIWPDIP